VEAFIAVATSFTVISRSDKLSRSVMFELLMFNLIGRKERSGKPVACGVLRQKTHQAPQRVV
jgi:hypothetical protein